MTIHDDVRIFVKSCLTAIGEYTKVHVHDPDGIVVPNTRATVRAAEGAADLGWIVREGSYTDPARACFFIAGVPLFFAGEDDGIEPYAISRRPGVKG
jgi:hypothetical protein